MKKSVAILYLVISFQLNAQGDFNYREFTKTMCSPEFHGRGYVNRGDSIAAAYIAQAYSQIGVTPVLEDYFQPFSLDVNTFPSRCNVLLSGKKLMPGQDYVAAPTSSGTCTQAPCNPRLFYSKFVSGAVFLGSSKKEK